MEFEKPNSIYFIKYIFKIPTGITASQTTSESHMLHSY